VGLTRSARRRADDGMRWRGGAVAGISHDVMGGGGRSRSYRSGAGGVKPWPVKVGVQLRPQHCEMQQLRAAWNEARRAGRRHHLDLGSLPTRCTATRPGAHYGVLDDAAAIAADTSHARFGAAGDLQPATATRTCWRTWPARWNQISGGRLILGLGSGWFRSATTPSTGTNSARPRSGCGALRESLPRIEARLARLNPSGGNIPLMIGGGGEKVTLRIVAERADLWNSFGPPENFAHKKRRPRRVVARGSGGDPSQIDPHCHDQRGRGGQRRALPSRRGATHLIVGSDVPFDLKPWSGLLQHARG